jgi:hypothetical protein
LPGSRKHLRFRGDAIHSEEAGGVEETTQTNLARLLIADDHALLREGLRTMLSGEVGKASYERGSQL